VNQHTVDSLRREGIKEQTGEGQILLVDGTPADAPGTVTVPLRVRGKKVTHSFTILPEMESDILLGIDVQAKLRLRVPTPPLSAIRDESQCCVAKRLAS